MVTLKRTHLARVLRHLKEGYPDEACGLLIGRRERGNVLVEESQGVRNTGAGRSSDRYEVDPADLLKAEKAARDAGRQIVGIFHSHPRGAARPSAVDLERAWGEYCYLIVSIRDGESGEWGCWFLREKPAGFEPAAVRLED